MADDRGTSLEAAGISRARLDPGTSHDGPLVGVGSDGALGQSLIVDGAPVVHKPVETPLTTTRFDNVDTLRAIAILLVMTYHYTAAEPPAYYFATDMPLKVSDGDLGVELFFVVSGYCISMTLLRTKSVVEFWCKRFARLHPAYVVAVILTFIAMTLFPIPDRHVSWPVALRNLFWSPFFNDDMVDGVYWSLLVELKFYFWLGVLRYAFPRLPLTLTWGLFTIVGFALTQVSEVWSIRLLIASLAPTFLIGIAAYERDRIGRGGVIAAIMLALAIMLMTDRFDDRMLLVAATCLFAYAVLQVQFKAPRALVWIGLISYPLYLVHQNIGLIIIRDTAPLVGPVYWRIGIAVAAVLLLATILNRTVELRYQRRLAAFFQRLFGVCVAAFPWPRRKRDDEAESVTW